ncbi:MAG: hypothetical protein U0U67_12940 [Chitinophagales bacterium]
MINSKLTEILKTFSPQEIEDLIVFTAKQSDKKNTLPQKLLLLLRKYYPEFDNRNLIKEKVYNKIFSDKKYDKNKLLKLMSVLTKIIEDYIVHARRKANIADEKMQLLFYYHEKHLDKYFNATSKELENIINDLPFGSYQNQMKYRYRELLSEHQVNLNVRGGSYYYYRYVYNELYEFIEAEQLKWENISLIDRINVEETPRQNGPFFVILKLINQLFKTEDERYFYDAMAMSKNMLHRFEKNEINEILTSLLNFAILKVNSGFLAYNEQLYQIYNLLIEAGLILNDNKMRPAVYKNYIHLCTKLNKFKEAKSFLEKYKSFLPDDMKEEIYNFNKAYILFEEADYDKALKILLNMKINDVYYELNQRRIIVKAYYELFKNDSSYFDLFQSSMNASKKFLYMQKNIPKIYIDCSKNFFRFLQKIEANANADKPGIEKIIKEIDSTANLYERNWLLNKLKEMV